jgi:hypothetical protein
MKYLYMPRATNLGPVRNFAIVAYVFNAIEVCTIRRENYVQKWELYSMFKERRNPMTKSLFFALQEYSFLKVSYHALSGSLYLTGEN